MIKLIAIDLDGTLLTDRKELPPDFFKIARSLISDGVAIVIASGRPFHNVAEIFKDLRDQLYFACDNGTYVVYGKEELVVNPLNRSSVGKFIQISRTLKNVYPVLCGKDRAFIENEDPEFMKQALKYYKEYKLVSDVTEIDEMILKISFCDLIDAETNCYPHYKKFESDYSVVVSGKIWLDITDRMGNKGVAIEAIQKRLNISPGETMAFGDYLNDLHMLQKSTHSYAMKNAHEEIKQAANHITRFDNNEYGVMDVIKKEFSR